MSLIPQNNNITTKGNGIRPLDENTSFLYARSKAEKLVAGVHMITRHMQDEEPLRTKLRSVSLSVLTDIVNAHSCSDGTLTSDLLEVMSLLSVSSAAQFISPNNVEIIKREYHALSVFIDENGESFANNVSNINSTYFDVPKPEIVTNGLNPSPSAQETSRAIQANRRAPVLKDIPVSKRQSMLIKPRIKSIAVIDKKNSRKEAILNLFRDHKGISVKDVVSVVSGVSEKTLQRELVGLVSSGILRKEGERRWSVYYRV